MINLPKIKTCLNTSEDDLAAELYSPCLRWAERYDRGVGYFTSGWISHNLCGLSDFAARGGKIRLITSPIISNTDYEAIEKAQNDEASFLLLGKALGENVVVLQAEMQKDIYNTFAWMVHDGIIDLKFAVPYNKLSDGNFHDKFGIFFKGSDALSFSGSINDSMQGNSNYESIKVFKSWAGTQEYVEADAQRFERLWNKKDPNLKVFSAPEGIKEKIFELRTSTRPYEAQQKPPNKWEHQNIAVEKFLKSKNGILAMATGTGKTITAITIMNRLFAEHQIARVVITMAGNDLLDQWALQIRATFKDKPVFSQYGSHKEMSRFMLHPDNALLLLSSDANNLSKLLNLLELHPGNYHEDTLFIFDEVHSAGSATRVENLSGKFSPYKYRLGLSATPEREYDEEGNGFIETEIGPILYTFSLEDAIKKGILCPFEYIPLSYELTDEEKRKKRNIIAGFNARKKHGEPTSESELYTQLSLVNKTAILKLSQFRDLLRKTPEVLKKSIIFVQTQDYGELVQEILLDYTDKYHTYYADDEKKNLESFAAGDLDCLLTCKKVSEGIDISRVTNIILFSSDRSRLVTTQRIGRALRLDNSNPDKIATVVDFILEKENDEADETADETRREWLATLAKVRREE